MTPGPALPCPKCRRVLVAEAWHDATSGQCRGCRTDFEFVPFPALTAAATRIAPQAAALEVDSACFFHAENRAENICEGCGRLLCAVCTVTFAGEKLCPACVAHAARSAEAAPVVRERPLYDSIALSVAWLPALVVLPTIVTAPLALGLVIFGWNRPGSIVRGGRRLRLVAAGVIALAEIVAWVAFFIWYSGQRH